VDGESNVYNGPKEDGVGSASDHSIDYHFCTTCGSTVYWTIWPIDGHTDAPTIGIAVGNFVDPEFPPPASEYYAQPRHRWMPAISSAETFNSFPQRGTRF
jgi:hypothetical protein